MDQKEVPQGANENCPGVNSEKAGKEKSCDGCPMQGACSSGQMNKPDPSLEKIKKKMADIKHKIFVFSGKGGVGKSTVSSQLAFMLANKGFEVGLMDIDICGPSIPRMLGLQNQEVHTSNDGWSPVYVSDNLGVMSIGFLLGNENDAVIWRGPRKNGLIKQFLTDVNWGELDFLIIDTPPGTSDEHISIVQYLQCLESDGAVVVTTPQEVSLLDVKKELSFCKKTNTNILGVVENMSGFVCPNCNCKSDIFAPVTGGAEAMCKDFAIDLLGKIPLDPKVLISAEKGQCISQENPDTQAAKVYNEIVDNEYQIGNQSLSVIYQENEQDESTSLLQENILDQSSDDQKLKEDNCQGLVKKSNEHKYSQSCQISQNKDLNQNQKNIEQAKEDFKIQLEPINGPRQKNNSLNIIKNFQTDISQSSSNISGMNSQVRIDSKSISQMSESYLTQQSPLKNQKSKIYNFHSLTKSVSEINLNGNKNKIQIMSPLTKRRYQLMSPKKQTNNKSRELLDKSIKINCIKINFSAQKNYFQNNDVQIRQKPYIIKKNSNSQFVYKQQSSQ
ncbi:P-loop containing nucleoside triphosphate hydrolase [Pseudocohnilembus persalinus]|uniref:Cytosolic Fe-S cluster assembly factor NUBP1 homolog n=1 Tax=Pseudocohnilembus persalinus TaxID=266149 RepID=A0A0V0QPN7_PSEPJ|nr:P-loop containing nucleoside triphosphate hydrolase [Pseudocohnilembus persalinus]|eukprot:KRX04156.1 P-loop containing nucleoside triphosphate hydrolase [Pseudocohnilembus persalinus]